MSSWERPSFALTKPHIQAGAPHGRAKSPYYKPTVPWLSLYFGKLKTFFRPGPTQMQRSPFQKPENCPGACSGLCRQSFQSSYALGAFQAAASTWDIKYLHPHMCGPSSASRSQERRSSRQRLAKCSLVRRRRAFKKRMEPCLHLLDDLLRSSRVGCCEPEGRRLSHFWSLVCGCKYLHPHTKLQKRSR